MSLLSDLLHFREEAARREGVESFRVLPKAAIDAIVFARPKSKEELIQIKGIKEAKYRKYGQGILAIVAAHGVSVIKEKIEEEKQEEGDNPDTAETLSVDQFLESINIELSGLAARIQGEVSEVNIWQNRLVFFSLKDTRADSVLKCSMSYQAYQLSGVFFAVGDEIIVEGFAKMYKPRGELSFTAVTAEFFGEGALKKAYDELYKKLELEGAFDPSLKREIPLYPQKLALVTSLDGAALGDFQMNLGRFGIKVDLYASGVEGQRAIVELVSAVRRIKKNAKNYDAMVIIRGGGSLESLQAFNNENLVREVLTSPIPVLAGIGHEKDITLTALVSDKMESTPTACAKRVSENFETARFQIESAGYKLPRLLEEALQDRGAELETREEFLLRKLQGMSEVVLICERQFLRTVDHFSAALVAQKEDLINNQKSLKVSFMKALEIMRQKLTVYQKHLEVVDPARILQLGYSLVRSGNKILRSTKELSIGDILEIELSIGKLETIVKKKL